MMQRKILVILENKPGALVRIVGLFHQRGYNIESLHVDPVSDIENYKDIEDLLNLKLKEILNKSDNIFSMTFNEYMIYLDEYNKTIGFNEVKTKRNVFS